jgi:hypothetical protein
MEKPTDAKKYVEEISFNKNSTPVFKIYANMRSQSAYFK